MSDTAGEIRPFRVEIPQESLDDLQARLARTRGLGARLGGPRLGERTAALLAEPRAWTVSRLWRRLRPAMSMRTTALSPS